MSTQETASVCLRLLEKHAAPIDRLAKIRLTPADLAALARQGIQVSRIAPEVVKCGRPRRGRPPVSRAAAIEWLDQKGPRHLSQKEMALRHGITQTAVSVQVSKERARRAALFGPLAHKLGAGKAA